MAEEQFQQLLERNQAALDQHQRMPLIDEARAAGFLNFGRPILLTCADARADPTHYLQLKPGELSILRNAGGHVTDDVIRSLELISTVGGLGMVIIVHHTDCGCLHTNDDEIRETLRARRPDHAGAGSIESKSWDTFQAIGLEQSVRNDLSLLKAWPFLPNDAPVLGYIFDIETGGLKKVE